MNKKNKKIFLSVLGFIVLIIVIFCEANNQRKLYDKSKPNIFEIPGTAYDYTSQNETYFDYYFMVQKMPSDTVGIRNMIDNFIDENHNIVSNSFKKGASYVFFHFMIPSADFPVYFEENKNYFIMDDYITHYRRTNEAVLVTFESADDSGDYEFRY